MSRLLDAAHALRSKHFERWLPAYLADRARVAREARPGGHVLFAICDHHEPLWGGASDATGRERLDRWLGDYPPLCDDFRDADGRPPRHSFFFPGEEIRDGYLERLAELTRAGLGEVELHLHHDQSDEAELRGELERYLDQMRRCGHLTTHEGRTRYGFIHGNWALANAHPAGRFCGIDHELAILHDTGCYADFTYPSVPDPSQPPIVNRIYWPTGDLARRASHEEGERAKVGASHDDRPLMIQGPLAVRRREGRLAPRLEYGALTAHDPPTRERVCAWLDQHISIEGQPDWIFIKLYTHGSPETQADALLGDGGRLLHANLAALCNRGDYRLHYVTAREMYNLACAAMAGESGDPDAFRDYVLRPPEAAG